MTLPRNSALSVIPGQSPRVYSSRGNKAFTRVQELSIQIFVGKRLLTKAETVSFAARELDGHCKLNKVKQ